MIAETFLTTPNPLEKESCVISFSHDIQLLEGHLKIFYVPDRDIVKDADYFFYIDMLVKSDWETPELFISTLAEAFYQSALPFHLEIHFIYKDHMSLDKHMCVVKTQPRYKIPARLETQLYTHF